MTKDREQQMLKASQLYPKHQQKVFVDGVLWGDRNPDLYSVTRKAVEREREYLMKKIVIWLDNNFITHDEYGVMSYQFDTVEEMIEDCKQAMEEQQQ